MGDDRVTVRLDEETKAWLDGNDTVNTSGLLRSLLDTYRTSGDAEKAALKERLHDREDELTALRREKAEIETQIERKQRQIDDLQKKITKREESVPEEVVEFAERVRSGAFRGELTSDNPAIQNWASKAGIRPDDFVSEVGARL